MNTQSRTAEHQKRVMEIRRSSAASKHVPKTRKGTRTSAKRRAMEDQ